MVLDASQIRLKHILHRISESIELDKPLHPQSKFKFPCSICNKNITKAQKAIFCNGCDKWTHIKCNGREYCMPSPAIFDIFFESFFSLLFARDFSRL